MLERRNMTRHWLVVTEEAFIPTDAGGRVETVNFLRAAVDAGVRVHAIIPGDGDQAAHRATLPQITTTWIPRRTGLSAHLSRRPYIFASRPIPRGLVPRLIALSASDPFDLVVSQTFRAAQVGLGLAQALRLPLVIRPHNLESDYFRRLSRSAVVTRRVPYLVEAWKVGRAERRLHSCEAVAAFADLSYEDARTRAAVSTRPVVHVPPFVATQNTSLQSGLLQPVRRRDGDTVLFIGSLDNANNQAAVRWFLSAVWPLIKAGRPTTLFHVVGRRVPKALQRDLALADVTLTSDAPSTAVQLAEASVFVNPVQQGSGVNIKVVEAMAAGLPVVSTKMGSRGLAWESGRDLLVVDDAAAFANAVVGLLDDDKWRLDIGQAGEDFVRRTLDGTHSIARLQELGTEAAGT